MQAQVVPRLTASLSGYLDFAYYWLCGIRNHMIRDLRCACKIAVHNHLKTCSLALFDNGAVPQALQVVTVLLFGEDQLGLT
jgi:hypothetical protein